MSAPSTELVERAPEPAPRGAVPGPPAIAIFGVIFAMLMLSVGGSALLLSGAGRFALVTEPSVISPVQQDSATAATPGTAATGDRVRVVSTGGSARATGGGAYEVTFRWMLEGARQSDPAVIHFYMGNTLLGEQRGALEPAVFSFASGAFTLTTEQECSASGWSADLVSIRGVRVDGDGIATVPGVNCP